MLLQDRVAFVTGAGSGIGRAGAIAMAAEGAIVIVTDRDVAKAQAVAEDIAKAGGRAEAHGLDVCDEPALVAAIAKTAARQGRLDILHSHAGIQIPGRLEDVTAEEMDRSWQLNVRSHFTAARAAMPVMKAQGKGSIIITSSNSGVQYDREMIAYATTKHAVIAMARQIAVDYARYNVRCNALCPGFVDTPLGQGAVDAVQARFNLTREAALAEVVSDNPMKRMIDPAEVVAAAIFLASPGASMVNGHALSVSGGEV